MAWTALQVAGHPAFRAINHDGMEIWTEGEKVGTEATKIQVIKGSWKIQTVERSLGNEKGKGEVGDWMVR